MWILLRKEEYPKQFMRQKVPNNNNNYFHSMSKCSNNLINFTLSGPDIQQENWMDLFLGTLYVIEEKKQVQIITLGWEQFCIGSNLGVMIFILIWIHLNMYVVSPTLSLWLLLFLKGFRRNLKCISSLKSNSQNVSLMFIEMSQFYFN